MGKSRYASLVKLKKKGLDEAERELIAANHDVSSAEERLVEAYELLRTFSPPQQGSIRELSQANMMIQSQHLAIGRCKDALEHAQQRQQQKKELYNRSMIEYEKFNYLEVQELNVRIKKLKDEEAKILDEIGTMTYKRETK